MTTPGDLAELVTALDTASLLPRRRSVAAPRDAVVLCDALELGEGLVLAVMRDRGGLMAAPLIARGGEPLRRAEPGEGAFERVLGRLASGRDARRFSFAPVGTVPVATGERPIDVDQSNESVVVGERAVVKLYPRPVTEPGPDLLAHLLSVGFTSIPTPFGAVRWRDDEERHRVVATAAAYLPGARDGWEWYLARLLGWLDGAVDEEHVDAPAAALGRLAAQMHGALATASSLVPSSTGTADEACAQAWRLQARAVADEALALTDGAEGARLAARTSAIGIELDRLGQAVGAVITPVHGDFHVGQVLEWEGGHAVADFDGNPMASPGSGRLLDTPVRDVAAFVRSIDHLGRLASRRRQGRHAALTAWIASSRAGFLGAYVDELAVLGQGHLFDERLLHPLEVAQACHEYVYAARFLPAWRPVADLAMCSLIPAEGREEA